MLEWESGKPIDRIVKPNRAIASVAETAAEIGSKAGDKNGGRSEWQDDTRILNQPKAELRTGWPDTSRNS